MNNSIINEAELLNEFNTNCKATESIIDNEIKNNIVANELKILIVKYNKDANYAYNEYKKYRDEHELGAFHTYTIVIEDLTKFVENYVKNNNLLN